MTDNHLHGFLKISGLKEEDCTELKSMPTKFGTGIIIFLEPHPILEEIFNILHVCTFHFHLQHYYANFGRTKLFHQSVKGVE